MTKTLPAAKPRYRYLAAIPGALACLTQVAFAQIAEGTPSGGQQPMFVQAPVSAPGMSALPRITNTRPEWGGAADSGLKSEGRSAIGSANRMSRAASVQAAGKDPFQEFVAGVMGASLPVFGRDLFTDVPDTYAPLNAAQANPEYVIGTGDEIQIRGWGMVDIDLTTTVDRSGTIYVPRVGGVKVAGLKYRDLQGTLKAAIGKNFSGFELTATISQTRSVQVYIVGNAARPGTYTVSAMSTLLNALFTSGGPSTSGTMRNIQLKRGGALVTTFDLYDMLVKGDKSRDVQLQDGDVIYIPETGPLVAITGHVKHPAIYELKSPSATVADVVGWAGGFESSAETKQVMVEKNVDNAFQAVAELTADGNGTADKLSKIPLRPAEVVRIVSPGAVPVQAQIRNEYVRVSGELQQTGVFQLRKGETLRELIARLGGTTSNGYIYALQLNRASVRSAQQERLNEVADRFEKEAETTAKQRLAGTTDKDVAATIAAEAERNRLIAQRMRSVKAQGRIILELEGSNAQVKNLPDIALQDGDTVYVPRIPGTVDVLGAVFQQGSFLYKPQRTVRDYLTLAGGPSQTADKSEIYILRADGTAQSGYGNGWFGKVDSTRLNPGDTVVVPEEIQRGSMTQSLKEWTAIFYQFGLGAAGLKVLKD